MTLLEVYKESLKFIGYIGGVIGGVIIFIFTLLNYSGIKTEFLAPYNTLEPNLKFLLTFLFFILLLVVAVISIFFIYIIYRLVDSIDKSVDDLTKRITNTGNGINTKSNEDDEKEILKLFNSEIIGIEKNIVATPQFTEEREMINYVLEDLQRGQISYFNKTPVYDQHSKEIFQYSDELSEKILTFYRIIQSIETNRQNFNVGYRQSGHAQYMSYDMYQILTYFENIDKARQLIPELKKTIQKEMEQIK
jgi:hypothetical protein